MSATYRPIKTLSRGWTAIAADVLPEENPDSVPCKEASPTCGASLEAELEENTSGVADLLDDY